MRCAVKLDYMCVMIMWVIGREATGSGLIIRLETLDSSGVMSSLHYNNGLSSVRSEAGSTTETDTLFIAHI